MVGQYPSKEKLWARREFAQQTDRGTMDRQTDGQRDRGQTDGQTEGQSDSYIPPLNFVQGEEN